MIGSAEEGAHAPAGADGSNLSSTSAKGDGDGDVKIDPVTALQDGIDGLSLAMFEALRGLRDAVAPESGNLGNADAANGVDSAAANNSSNNNQQQPDSEELWQAYRQNDPSVTALFESLMTKYNMKSMPHTREDVARIHAKMEQSQDTELVFSLARTVLEKSRWIDTHVDNDIPGMHRTMTEQMQRIQELLTENETVLKDLQDCAKVALDKRNACRSFVRTNTCRALGIQEETNIASLPTPTAQQIVSTITLPTDDSPQSAALPAEPFTVPMDTT